MTATIHASKYNDWKEQYNWDTCITNRKDYGEFLSAILTSQNAGHVLNLNGAWGAGKTEFLKRIYISLAEKQYPVIYIDAWESDFIKDPLSVICSEFLNQLGFIFNHTDKTKFSEVSGVLNKLMLRISNLLTILKPSISAYKAFSPDASYSEELDFAQTLLEMESFNISQKGVIENNLDIIQSMLGSQIELVEGMKDVRRQITAISEILENVYEFKCPIVVLVDELDRCRPDYAIKMLEVIKHFFDVEGCNFLIATDTSSLQQSIKAVYGNEFDSERYLRRFFNQKISLPRPSIETYIKNKKIDFVGSYPNLKLVPFNQENKLIEEYLSVLLDDDRLQLRDIERILQKIEGSLKFINENYIKKVEHLNIAVLAYGILEYETEQTSFRTRNNYTKLDSKIKSRNYLDLDLAEFINMNLRLMTTVSQAKKYDFSGGSTAYNRVQTILSIQASSYPLRRNPQWSKSNFIQCFEAAIREYEANNKRYWLWEDYSKIIALTGAIE